MANLFTDNYIYQSYLVTHLHCDLKFSFFWLPVRFD